MTDKESGSNLPSRGPIFARLGMNARISDIVVINTSNTADLPIMLSALALSVEGDEVARVALMADPETPQYWNVDGELELPGEIEQVDFSLLTEESCATVGSVSLTGYDLLFSRLDEIDGVIGKATINIPSSTYKISWDCIAFCEETTIPNDLSPEDVQDLKAFASHIAGLRDQLYSRYNQSGNLTDIEKAIKAAETVCCLDSNDKKVLPLSLHNLGVMCLTCYQGFGNVTTLRKAIAILEQAIEDFPEGPNKISLLINLATGYGRYVDHLRDMVSLEKSLSVSIQAVALAEKYDGTFLAPSLFSLSSAYERQYMYSNGVTVLGQAMEACEKALNLTNDGDPKKAMYQDRLGWMKQKLFETTNIAEHLEQAVALGKSAVNSTPDHSRIKANFVNNLANALHTLWQYSGNAGYLEEALTMQRMVLKTMPDYNEHKHIYWDTLGTLSISQWQQSCEKNDIVEAVNAHEMALRIMPLDHANKAQYLINLANAYLGMFSETGDMLHLQNALTTLNESNSQICEDNPMKPNILSSIANVHLWQFDFLHQIEDIEQAILGYKTAIRHLGSNKADIPFHLQQLAHAMTRKYDATSDLSDIKQAVSALKEANELITPDHPKRPGLLIDLGAALQAECDHFGIGGSDISMVEKAIEAHTTALLLDPEEYHLAALSHSYLAKFEYTHNSQDIDKAIEIAQKALEKCLDIDPYRVVCYGTLGDAYNIRYEQSRSLDDIREAVSAYANVARFSISSPDKRLDSALRWARTSNVFSELNQSAIEAYEYAIKLIPQIVWQGLPLSKRYNRIKVIGDLANEAVFFAVGSCQYYALAIEWLEQARSIIWGQLLRLRSPVERLSMTEPALAEQYMLLAQSLQAISVSETVNEHKQSGRLSQQAAQRHAKLAGELELLVKQIQSTPGLEHFLQPHSFSELMQASQYGIIVIISVYRTECHSLIIKPGLSEPQHILLPDFNYAKAEDMQKALKFLLDNAGRTTRDASRLAQMVPMQESYRSLSGILAELWKVAAEPILSGLDLIESVGPSHDLAHLWWCLTGPIAFLPMHAAGIYSGDQVGNKVSDFVVSSYIPTITALLEAMEHRKSDFHGVVAVSQPQTPGLRLLPNTKEELVRIKTNMEAASIGPLTTLEHSEAKVEVVMKCMEEHSWVHFACHALQDVSSPLDSAFHLYDGKVELSRIIQKPLLHADFAFLSACQTASGDENLPEENMHLAAGMLAAGYSSIIATMWSIMDDDAPIIANEVYKYLLMDGKPDSSKAAYALHHAIRQFQQQFGNSEKSLLSLVPFIHVGI